MFVRFSVKLSILVPHQENTPPFGSDLHNIGLPLGDTFNNWTIP